MCLGGGGGVTGNANVAHRPAQDLGPRPATLIVSAPSHYWGPAAAILHLQGVMGGKMGPPVPVHTPHSCKSKYECTKCACLNRKNL